jgi:hypothetical protein
MKKISLSLLALAAAVALVPFASADTLNYPTVGSSTVPAGVPLDSVSGTATSTGGNPYTVSFTESVYSYDLAGDLAFVYSATDTGGDFIDAFSTIFPALYADATVDDISGALLTNVIEDLTDGSISAGFTPALSGAESTEFVIYTTAKTYGPGQVFFQDGSQTVVEGLVPTPEPGSLFLLGTGLLGLGLIVRQKLTN